MGVFENQNNFLFLYTHIHIYKYKFIRKKERNMKKYQIPLQIFLRGKKGIRFGFPI